MRLFLAIGIALAVTAPAMAACLPDDSMVQMRGTIKEVRNRDKHTGAAYSYFVVAADQPYCIIGGDGFVDHSDPVPTVTISVLPRDKKTRPQSLGALVGRPVIMTGQLSSTNGGGPLLFYDTVTRIARD